jgi:hypothetical protein
MVRPAWAHSCGCKFHRKLITANEAKRSCMRVTECGEEARSEAASLACHEIAEGDKNRMVGVAEQGERAIEAPVIKAKRRRSGGCAGKACILTLDRVRGRSRETSLHG